MHCFNNLVTIGNSILAICVLLRASVANRHFISATLAAIKVHASRRASSFVAAHAVVDALYVVSTDTNHAWNVQSNSEAFISRHWKPPQAFSLFQYVHTSQGVMHVHGLKVHDRLSHLFIAFLPFDKSAKYCVQTLQHARCDDVAFLCYSCREFLMHFKVWLLH